MVSSNSCGFAPQVFNAASRTLGHICVASPASAWNATGHRDHRRHRLCPSDARGRARVDALLDQHPDYATLFTQDAPADAEGRARAAFLAAAVWPDMIKGDPTFLRRHPCGRPVRRLCFRAFQIWSATPTGTTSTIPLRPRRRHFSTSGCSPTPWKKSSVCLETSGNPAVNYVYDLPWLVHLEGDLHQPLHCTSRFLKSQPEGDAGGNLVFVTPGRNLHSVWDDSGGHRYE